MAMYCVVSCLTPYFAVLFRIVSVVFRCVLYRVVSCRVVFCCVLCRVLWYAVVLCCAVLHCYNTDRVSTMINTADTKSASNN